MLGIAEIADLTEVAYRLQDAYISAGIVTGSQSEDALHVAIASASNCGLVVSWNFRHIVHFRKIPLYNAINILEGFNQIGIFSPLEVLSYEEEI